MSHQRPAGNLVATGEVLPRTYEQLVATKVGRTVFRKDFLWTIKQPVQWVTGRVHEGLVSTYCFCYAVDHFLRPLGKEGEKRLTSEVLKLHWLSKYWAWGWMVLVVLTMISKFAEEAVYKSKYHKRMKGIRGVMEEVGLEKVGV